jgi:hypothetical protein
METSADERIRVHLADAESKAKSAEHSLAEAKRDRLRAADELLAAEEAKAVRRG